MKGITTVTIYRSVNIKKKSVLNIIVRFGLRGVHSQQTPKMFEPNGLARTCVDFLFIIGGCVKVASTTILMGLIGTYLTLSVMQKEYRKGKKNRRVVKRRR